MSVVGRIVRDRYQDSVRLMRIGESLRTLPGVRAIGLISATPANLEVLRTGGLWFEGADDGGPNDIAIAVDAADDAAASDAIDRAIEALDAVVASGRVSFGSTEAALAAAPADAIGFVAVPGEHAAAEARRVIGSGRSVVVFSDNVSLADERAVKTEAHAAGLLVMGPDAGTVSLGGIGLGFCNALPPGRVGLVAASGTGAQALSSMLARAGEGISAIVGLGGRDASDDVGGISMFDALAALEADPATEVIALVAKTVGPATRARLLSTLASMTTPVVTLVPGWADGWITAAVGAFPAASTAEACARVLGALGAPRTRAIPEPLDTSRGPAIRGLFAGGTLAQETARALDAIVGDDATRPVEVVDLGDDEYTRGRPHPMIAPSIVADEIRRVAAEPEVGAIVFDVVLGHGAHPDPAGLLAEAAAAVMATASAPALVAILCGTVDDLQGAERSRAALVAAGCVVTDDPLEAAWLVAGTRAAVAAGARGVPSPPAVIVIGTDWFAESIERQGVEVLHVDWRPPAGGDDELASILGRLT